MGSIELLGRHDPLVPPRHANFVGNSDFQGTGDEFLKLFIKYAGLSSADRVLDAGCGIGRMARPLTRVLSPPMGSYDGFDVVADAVAWCQKRYRDTSVPFRFAHVDLHNAEYNPTGRERRPTSSASRTRMTRSISPLRHRCSRTCSPRTRDITWLRSLELSHQGDAYSAPGSCSTTRPTPRA